ncbi:putative electron transfer flavoprotein FixA [Lacrimispora saccharolytica]|uniref:Electron transfer flavoprotein small subunit n=1 Tax=Lacrimispora saccharolytica (strain ATCC 35040 / DSM 2544 / NRCC 2533 / WM1) TaxID=610130 RepID=D9R1C7_LACSW|nr:putative electron transfer flavoprotein FixA [Lacrimispora saccharolytica]ADL06450.1 Electron transfer flavoprotein alpha/beta-subunit [[Clostridium] saccharolyticum WM1]QRV19466.1 putative electron transfer flavoprotein FixA [Lacrimispora saccharolytica]
MKIIACCKIVPNEEEISILPSRELSMTGASLKISQYDLNALETGKQLASETMGTMTALSVGPAAALTNSKIRKDILSRGADELSLVQDDSNESFDSLQTAKAIAGALKLMEYDVVICGAGSSDLYAQEVGIQTGTLLGIPVMNNVTGIKVLSESMLLVERTLEDEVETLEIPLPAVLSVSSEINIPAVPSMRDIMKAGKKPVNELNVEAKTDASAQTLEQLAPAVQDRRQEIIEGDGEEAVGALVQFLKKEGF